jgi:hypothetical protein
MSPARNQTPEATANAIKTCRLSERVDQARKASSRRLKASSEVDAVATRKTIVGTRAVVRKRRSSREVVSAKGAGISVTFDPKTISGADPAVSATRA